jgi:hypothetical protein
MDPRLNLQPGLDCQALVWRRFGKPINVSTGFSRDSFVLVVSFGRCKLALTVGSVGFLLQATIGGFASAFQVRQLSDRVFHKWVFTSIGCAHFHVMSINSSFISGVMVVLIGSGNIRVF